MKLRKHTHLFGKVTLTIIITICFLVQGYSQVRKRLEIASFIDPGIVNTSFWVNHARFSGGVSPLGQAQFYASNSNEIDSSDLSFLITDASKLTDDELDNDALALVYNSEAYQLYTQDYLLLPLLKYVKRQGTIAYTIPPFDPDSTYLAQNKLIKSGASSYVAEEFNTPPMIDFLYDVDLDTDVEYIEDPILLDKIQQNVSTHINHPINDLVNDGGSYVNTDQVVNYKFYLEVDNGKNVVNTAGLPLRYTYQYDATRDVTYITEIEVFSFPEELYGLQDEAIVFFQTAALFRRFYKSNPDEFNRLMDELEEIFANQ